MRFSVTGESLIDVIQRLRGDVDEVPVGIPANVALGWLGRNVTLQTALADDVRGGMIANCRRAAGVAFNVEAIVRTGTAAADQRRSVPLTRSSTSTGPLAPFPQTPSSATPIWGP